MKTTETKEKTTGQITCPNCKKTMNRKQAYRYLGVDYCPKCATKL